MNVPVDLPEPLRETIALSERLDGECVIYDPDDVVVYANAAFRHHYAFVGFNNASYGDVFQSSVKQGLYGASELRMSPDEYLAMAKAVRKANERLDFIKRYVKGDMLGHHRMIDGWSVQVRLPVDSPLWRGGFGGVVPNSLAEAAGAADAVRRMRVTLDALSTGLAFLDNDGDVVWANGAAHAAFENLIDVELIGDRLRFHEAGIAREFTKALNGVLSGPTDTRKYIALRSRQGASTICSLVATSPGEALLLIAPSLDGGELECALRGFGLSPKETEVAMKTAGGMSTRQVAEATEKSINTIRAQLGAVMRKGRDTTPSTRTGTSALVYRIASVAGIGRRRH